jgi:AraC family transcriptional regulator, positive regulator of tynA and feaB
MDLSCNAHRVERTQRDARLDNMECYYAVFQMWPVNDDSERSDRETRRSDAALIHSARPVTSVSENGYRQWFSLQLSRRSLVSHLGFEPQYGFCGRCETCAGRLLFQLVLDAGKDEESMSARAGS